MSLASNLSVPPSPVRDQLRSAVGLLRRHRHLETKQKKKRKVDGIDVGRCRSVSVGALVNRKFCQRGTDAYMRAPTCKDAGLVVADIALAPAA